jgi:hypothetical protein
MSLTDKQLKTLCKKMSIPLEGVVFKDEIPKKLKYNTSYIINLDDEFDEKTGMLNSGSHWTCLVVMKYKDNKIKPFYFDPYGAPPPEDIKKAVLESTGQKLPFNTKNVQSLMGEVCGFFCCAILHYVFAYPHKKGDIYEDVEDFLFFFDDLNQSIDFKKNEYILKHFFQPSDPKLRKEIDVGVDGTDRMIVDNGQIDLTKI